MDINILTVEQVAEELKISKRKALSLCRTGEIKAVKVGKFWRIADNAVKEYIIK